MATTDEPAARTFDRRNEIRRETDRALHYAREGLLAAAVAVVETAGFPGIPALRNAVANYREAEKLAEKR